MSYPNTPSCQMTELELESGLWLLTQKSLYIKQSNRNDKMEGLRLYHEESVMLTVLVVSLSPF